MQEPTLAYSLSQSDDGWRWCVYDLDGVTVADGSDATRDAAQAAVERSMRTWPVEGDSESPA